MAGIIRAVVANLIITALAIPTVKDTTDAQSVTGETLTRSLAPGAETETLAKAAAGLSLETASLTITGLATPANYTINYNTGVVTWNASSNGTYAASYDYYEANYLTDSTDRSLMGVVILMLLVGLVGYLFMMGTER